MSRPTLDSAGCIPFSGTRLSLPLACFSKTVPLACAIPSAVRTPDRSRPGLGSSHFARRYFGNRFFFLFLRLLRCFSSPGSLCNTMYSCCSDNFLRLPGFPIRISMSRSLFAARHGFSQLTTSFVGSWCQGIRPMLLLA